MLRAAALALILPLLAACGAESVYDPLEEAQARAYRAEGPATLTLLTAISNRSGAGGRGLHGSRAPRRFQGDANRPSSSRPGEAIEGCQTHCRPGFVARWTGSAPRMCRFR